MSHWNKTSTEWGRICSSWKNCRKYQRKKGTDWSRLASWKKINPSLIRGRCRCGSLTSRCSPGAPGWRAPWPPGSSPPPRTPSSPWPLRAGPGHTRPCLVIWVWASRGSGATAPSRPAPTPRPSDTSSSRPRWRPAWAVTSRSTEMLRYVPSARPSPDQGIPRSQKRKNKNKSFLCYLFIILQFISVI